MNDENAILAYYQGIRDGSITVGRWIRTLYEMIVEGLESKRWYFDQRKASTAIRFIERFCHHYKGELAPARLKLSLWQRAAVSLIFGIVDKEGARQFTECLFVVGRKQGKTLVAAGVMTFLAYCGEYGSEVFFLAPKLAQADLAFSALEFNVSHEPDLNKRTKSTKSRGLYIKETNTMIQKLPFTDKKSDGYNPAGWVADEVAAWAPAERSLKQWEVMVSGTGARREPLGLAISSAGYENDGIFDELFKRGTAFLNGNSREQHLLPLIYMIDDPEKWDDINELRKSLPGLGESVSVKFILKEIDTAHESLSKRTEFLTKYCNVKQNSSQAWFPAAVIKKAFGYDYRLEDFRNCYALGGIDLSQTTDLTACCVLIEREGIIWAFVQFFLPAEKLAEATARDGVPYGIMAERGLLRLSGDNFVNYEDCFAWFRELVEKYKIFPLMTGYDRYSAQYLVQDMQKYGFHMESVFQGFNLTGVEDNLEGLLKNGVFRCANDNDLLKLHFLDAAQATETGTSAHARKKLVKISKNAHVDGVAAILDALCMRQNHWSELGGQLMNAG